MIGEQIQDWFPDFQSFWIGIVIESVGIDAHRSRVWVQKRDLRPFAAAARALEPVVPVQLLNPAHRIHASVHI